MENKISKKIHYCWFGKGEKSKLMKKCIKSWKRYLPDYEIIEWNEDNYDFLSNDFCREAYENKKWAFVSDYARLDILYKNGGIYMDTDVEIIKNIDELLLDEAFIGFENKDYLSTAVIGAQKENLWIKEVLEYYRNRRFIKQNGEMDLIPNPVIITGITCEKYNLKIDNSSQNLNSILRVYPKEYFSPKNVDRTSDISLKTYAIHHFNGSWLDENSGVKKMIADFIISNFDIKVSSKIFSLYQKIKKLKNGE